jgi:magnesium-transporting ATPase (P-type)
MQICYFFYKNIAFGFTLFWFEAYASFSGQPAYNDWYMSFYNVFFTSLPVIALGVFDQDVSARLCLKVQNHCSSLGFTYIHSKETNAKPRKKHMACILCYTNHITAAT